ncbi:hypothetical protein [Arthrobacter yangruifuii]|uniref:hypothetical protein n=1 Tax=Arthrobacter yangruifuii TaxID=2606616 RepID=UPI0011B5406D|nr:hypothetical protein [Arthrobacter yangruifuii]
MTITACAETEPSPAISAREGRDRVVELVFNTAEQLDVTGWWPRNGAAWAQECTPESSHGLGDATASYSYDRWAPQGTDHVEDAQRVAEYWESLGMTVRTINPTKDPVVFAEGGPVLRAEFDTDAPEQSYSISAIAPCSPGDAYTLNEEDSAERDQGKVLPGDEGLVLQEEPPQ